MKPITQKEMERLEIFRILEKGLSNHSSPLMKDFKKKKNKKKKKHKSKGCFRL